jgi:hypothetical protein
MTKAATTSFATVRLVFIVPTIGCRGLLVKPESYPFYNKHGGNDQPRNVFIHQTLVDPGSDP